MHNPDPHPVDTTTPVAARLLSPIELRRIVACEEASLLRDQAAGSRARARYMRELVHRSIVRVRLGRFPLV